MRLVRPSVVATPTQAPPAAAGATLGSVGVPSGTALAAPPGSLPAGWTAGNASSMYYIDGDNTVISGYAFPAPGSLTKNVLTVRGNNVTIKNCTFTGDANRGVDTFNAGGTTVVQDCRFLGNFDDAAVSGPNFIVDRCEFSGMGNDGVKMGDDSIVRNSWMHDFNTVPGGHSDGIQGIDTPHRITIYNTVIDLGLGGSTGVLPNSAIIITPWTIVESGPSSATDWTITIDKCTFGGGMMTFHLDIGFTKGIRVTNCRFLTDQAGAPIQNTDSGTPIPAPYLWSGNVKHDGVTPMAWTDNAA